MKSSEILNKAIDVIKTVGWCRGERQSPAGECCLVGAVEKAKYGQVHVEFRNGNPYEFKELKFIIRAVNEKGLSTDCNDGYELSDVNDRLDDSDGKCIVLDLLTRAQEIALEEEVNE